MVAREMHESVVSETGERDYRSQRPPGKTGLGSARIADSGSAQPDSSGALCINDGGHFVLKDGYKPHPEQHDHCQVPHWNSHA